MCAGGTIVNRWSGGLLDSGLTVPVDDVHSGAWSNSAVIQSGICLRMGRYPDTKIDARVQEVGGAGNER